MHQKSVVLALIVTCVSCSRLTLGDAHNAAAAAVVFMMGMTSGWVASSCMVTQP